MRTSLVKAGAFPHVVGGVWSRLSESNRRPSLHVIRYRVAPCCARPRRPEREVLDHWGALRSEPAHRGALNRVRNVAPHHPSHLDGQLLDRLCAASSRPFAVDDMPAHRAPTRATSAGSRIGRSGPVHTCAVEHEHQEGSARLLSGRETTVSGHRRSEGPCDAVARRLAPPWAPQPMEGLTT